MKKAIKISQAIKALKWTRKAKIPIQLNLILGYIGEDKETLLDTENFIKFTLPDIMQISFIIAMRGTEFTNLAIKNKWISDSSIWQSRISELQIDRNKYKPFQLNFQKEIRKLFKVKKPIINHL